MRQADQDPLDGFFISPPAARRAMFTAKCRAAQARDAAERREPKLASDLIGAAQVVSRLLREKDVRRAAAGREDDAKER